MSAVVDRRTTSLGNLNILYDHTLLHILSYFTTKELIFASGVSPAFYIFCTDEGLWQDHFLADTKGTFEFKGTWKLTTLYRDYPAAAPRIKHFHFEGIYSPLLYGRWYRAHADVSNFGEDTGMLERRHISDLSVSEFVDKYDGFCRPVLLCGAADHWIARKEWTKEHMLQKYGESEFKVSERGSRKFAMKLKDYVNYINLQHDEEPLYIFDSGFGERSPEMLKEYEVPPYFPEDLFVYLGKFRPSYRWFVMGPARSGAPFHIDPVGTSAWNTLLQGRKRWMLYPPGDLPPGVFSTGGNNYHAPSSLIWLLEVYPTLQPHEKPIEVIQKPGETIYVPGGWWHMVLNMEDTIAVTQNFANTHNFDAVCSDLSDETRDQYEHFKKTLCEAQPNYVTKFKEFEKTHDEIQVAFDKIKFWGPFVRKALALHGYEAAPDVEVEHLADGTNPVFLVNKMVVKFYSRETGGERSFQAESAMYEAAERSQHLKGVIPKLLGKGHMELEQRIDREKKKLKKKKQAAGSNNIMMASEHPPVRDGANDGTSNGAAVQENGKGNDSVIVIKSEWPYIVMTYIEGENILAAREEEIETDMKEVATFLAKNIRHIHSLQSNDDESKGGLINFLEKRKNTCLKRHWVWRTLPVHLITDIEAYLLDINDLVDFNKVVSVHGDITDENVIGEVVDEKPAGKAKRRLNRIHNIKGDIQKWKPKYIIDFGDSRQCDILYELVSLHFSVFECDKEVLKTFLKNYLIDGVSLWDYYYPHSNKQHHQKHFVHKAMCYTLLHECDAIRTAFRHLPTAMNAKSLSELANIIWDLS